MQDSVEITIFNEETYFSSGNMKTFSTLIFSQAQYLAQLYLCHYLMTPTQMTESKTEAVVLGKLSPF